MKKLICMLLSLIMLMSTIVLPVYAEEIELDSSMLGGFSAVFDTKTGTLTFSGKGYVKVTDTSVWQGMEQEILKVVFEEGITMITNNSLTGLYYIETVVLPTTLTTVIQNAFAYAENLQYVIYNGTEEEWAKVKVTESGNKSLLNAKFTFGSGEDVEQEKVIEYFFNNISDPYPVTQNSALTSLPAKINARDTMGNIFSVPLTYLNTPDLTVVGTQDVTVVAEIPEGYTLLDGVSNQFSFTVAVNAANPSGRCGANATWKLYSWGELSIYGDSYGISLADFDNTTDNKTPWYAHNSDIISVTIGGGIARLGNDLFSDTNVVTVDIPQSVTDLNAKAFRNAKSLEVVEVESTNTTYYDNGYFIYSADRKTLVLYEQKSNTGSVGVDMATKIGEYAFANCALESVYIYPEVTEIADNAFEGCDNIVIYTPAGSYAYDYAVENGIDVEIIRTEITSVNAPSDVSAMLYSEVKLPETTTGVTSYGTIVNIPLTYEVVPSTEALGTTAVTAKLVVPEGYALKSGLSTTVTFDFIVTPASGAVNENVTWAYDGNGVLTLSGNGTVGFTGDAPWKAYADKIIKVVIDEGITAIDSYAFDGLAVTTYEVDAYNNYYCSDDGIIFNSDLTSLVRYPSHKEGEEYVVPDTVLAILEHAFYGCVNLKKVTLGENITSMADTGLENSDITVVVVYGSYAHQYAQNNGITSETKTSIVESGIYNKVTYTLYSDGYLYLEYVGNTTTSHLPIDLEAVKVLECAEGMTGFAWQLVKRMTNLETIKLPSTFNKTDFLDGTTWVSEVIIADGNESLCTADGAVYSITANGLNMLYYLYSEEKVFTMTAENVFGVEYGAFDNAVHLEKIILNGDIAYIDSVFEGCNNLKEFYIEPAEGNYFGTENGVLYNLDYNVKRILVRMPQNSSITDFAVPDTVTILEDYAFNDCKNLVNVTMGDNVVNKRNVGDGCYALFENAVNLESVVLSNNYEEIHNDTFKGCVKLKNFNFPENLKYIGYSAFEGCASLTGTLEIPSTVTSTDDSVFKGTGYSEVIIPSSLTYIEPDMFADCVNLEKVTLADGVEDISSRVFSGCSKLKEINFPDSIDSIGGSAFYNCTSLEEAVVNNATVYGSAFSGCTALTDFSLNSGAIRGSVFSGCTSLENVTLGDAVSEIGGGAFHNCTSLTAFTIPKGVKTINKNIFGGCVNLKTLVINSENATFYNSAFEGNDFIEEIILPENIKLIGNAAFAGTSITSIEIPAGLVKMNTGVFENCTKLVTAKLSPDFDNIPNSTFAGCTSLKEVYISNSVKTIFDNAFMGCTAIEKVYYSGTKDEWSKVIIEYGNDSLLKADVICTDGAITEPSLGATFYENWDGSVSATVYIPEEVVKEEAKLVMYYTNANGEVEALSYDVTSEDEACYDVQVGDATVKTVTVYLWEDFVNIQPLAAPKTLVIRD